MNSLNSIYKVLLMIFVLQFYQLTSIEGLTSQEIVRDLPKYAEIDANMADEDGITLISYASAFAPEHLKMLIEKKANIEAKDKNGNTPLIYAIMYQPQPESVKILLAHGAKAEHKNNQNRNVYELCDLTLLNAYENLLTLMQNKEIFSNVYNKENRLQNDIIAKCKLILKLLNEKLDKK